MNHIGIKPASRPSFLLKTSRQSWRTFAPPWNAVVSGGNCGIGADALRLLTDGEFQGIVSDMRTPGGSTARRSTPGLPTIA